MGQRGNFSRQNWNYFVILYNYVQDSYQIILGPVSKAIAERELLKAQESFNQHASEDEKSPSYLCLGEERGDRMIRALVRCEHCPECRRRGR